MHLCKSENKLKQQDVTLNYFTIIVKHVYHFSSKFGKISFKIMYIKYKIPYKLLMMLHYLRENCRRSCNKPASLVTKLCCGLILTNLKKPFIILTGPLRHEQKFACNSCNCTTLLFNFLSLGFFPTHRRNSLLLLMFWRDINNCWLGFTF